MALLGAEDPLARRPQRIVVAGASGAGKTTVAARIGSVLGIAHVEIDALFHGPGWTRRPSFPADVDRFSAEGAWVTEWQYDEARELLAERADLMVWLDLSRRAVMRQVIGRTVRRRVRREALWNGNVEPPLWTILTDREHVVRWAWATHRQAALRVAAARGRRPDLAVVRLTDRGAVQRWVDGPLRQAGALPADGG